jgi:hypothetical protein
MDEQPQAGGQAQQMMQVFQQKIGNMELTLNALIGVLVDEGVIDEDEHDRVCRRVTTVARFVHSAYRAIHPHNPTPPRIEGDNSVRSTVDTFILKIALYTPISQIYRRIDRRRAKICRYIQTKRYIPRVHAIRVVG